MTDRENSEAEKAGKKTGKKTAMITILLTEAVVIVALLFVIYFWHGGSAMNVGNNAQADNTGAGTQTAETGAKDTVEETLTEPMDGIRTILLVGTDGRTAGDYEEGSADAMMLAVLDENTKSARILSICRDTAFETDESGTIRKARYVYEKNGAEALLGVLNRNLDLSVNEYMIVDMNALADAVDAVGGITLKLTDEEASYTNHYVGDVAKLTGGKTTRVGSGNQTLNGVQAAAYCRIRYTDGGDKKRSERTRNVLTALAEEAQSATAAELGEMFTEWYPGPKTSMELTELVSLAKEVRDYTIEDTEGFPFASVSGNYGKAGVLEVPCTLSDNAKELYAYLYPEEEYAPSKTVEEISNDISAMTGLDASDLTAGDKEDDEDDE